MNIEQRIRDNQANDYYDPQSSRDWPAIALVAFWAVVMPLAACGAAWAYIEWWM